jgi:hypothetical protein
MPRVEGRWRLQLGVLRHQASARPALLAAPAEALLRDVILARAALLAALPYSRLLANALSHNLPLGSCRPGHLYPANVTTDSAPDGKCTVSAACAARFPA